MSIAHWWTSQHRRLLDRVRRGFLGTEWRHGMGYNAPKVLTVGLPTWMTAETVTDPLRTRTVWRLDDAPEGYGYEHLTAHSFQGGVQPMDLLDAPGLFVASTVGSEVSLLLAEPIATVWRWLHGGDGRDLEARPLVRWLCYRATREELQRVHTVASLAASTPVPGSSLRVHLGPGAAAALQYVTALSGLRPYRGMIAP